MGASPGTMRAWHTMPPDDQLELKVWMAPKPPARTVFYEYDSLFANFR